MPMNPTGGDDVPRLFTPESFRRHSEAFSYVPGAIRTNGPFPGRGRFPHASPGAWGILRAGDSITAASGVTIGTGSVDLCESDGTAFDPIETVDVKNAGPAISATADKILALEWTAGDWSVCECGEGGTSCWPCPIPKRDLVLNGAIISPLVLHYAPGYLVSNPSLDWHTDCYSLAPEDGNGRWVFGCDSFGHAQLCLQQFYDHITHESLPCTPEFTATPTENAFSCPALVPGSTCEPLSITFGDPDSGGIFFTVTTP